MTIKNVIENGYCVGCAGCKLKSPDTININLVDSGFYQASINKKYDSILDKVCPFSDHSANESNIAKKIYNSGQEKYDEKVGLYLDIYAGYVNDEDKRVTSSSGGLTTWLAEKLLEGKKIDAIAHVGFKNGRFRYIISKTVQELNDINNKKSRYYPVTLDDIQDYLSSTQDKILFIGIPCYVKSIRLLQQQGLLKNVVYCFSLLCGHMKSSGFGESLAWQLGVNPKDQYFYDFRLKKSGYKSSEYFFESTDIHGNKKQELNGNLLGSNWGLGFFRHKACNFCDDIAGETADITVGDAWTPKYMKDYLGTNILLVRNPEIKNILEQYKNELTLELVDVATFYETQLGNYGNRRGGTLAQMEKNKNKWYPKKRVEICVPYKGDNKKNKIYIYRAKLSELSIVNFNKAKKLNSFGIFKLLMFPYLLKYTFINSGTKSAILFLVPNRLKTILKSIKR